MCFTKVSLIAEQSKTSNYMPNFHVNGPIKVRVAIEESNGVISIFWNNKYLILREIKYYILRVQFGGFIFCLGFGRN